LNSLGDEQADILLGIQVIVDGLTMMLVGRLHMPALPHGGTHPAGT